jgi:hypothetical protein
LTGEQPFGVFVYGFAPADAYGYPGGMSLSPVVIVTNVTLTPETATNPVGTEHCVIATVTDQDASPVAGIRVDFTVTGVNPTAGFASTSDDGQAEFCYRGSNIGEDTIVAAVGSIVDSATKTWVEVVFQFSDGSTTLTVEATRGIFSLAYVVDGVSQRCSGGRARLETGVLTIASRCLEDVRDVLRAIGPMDGIVTVQLLDRTGPTVTDRTVRRFRLRPQ